MLFYNILYSYTLSLCGNQISSFTFCIVLFTIIICCFDWKITYSHNKNIYIISKLKKASGILHVSPKELLSVTCVLFEPFVSKQIKFWEQVGLLIYCFIQSGISLNCYDLYLFVTILIELCGTYYSKITNYKIK